MRLAILLLAAITITGAERKPIYPPGVKPVGPYSPGILTDDYLYVSGQGARDAQAQLASSFDAQAKQCLENVKAVIEGAGLKMENVVYTQVYLADIKQYDAVNKAYAAYFPQNAPARALIGVTRMPTDTPIEINAVAVRDLKLRKQIPLPATRVPGAPISYGVHVGNRFYLGGLVGIEMGQKVAPKSPRAQVELMVRRAKDILRAGKLELRHLAAAIIYVDSHMPLDLLAKLIDDLIPSETATTVIQTASLPFGAHVEITGIASRELKREGKCSSVGDTIFCPGRAGAVNRVLKDIGEDLQSARAGMTNVVASNVFLDNIDNFNAMNKVYATHFSKMPPTRTTVQPSDSPAELALKPSTNSTAVADGPRVQIAVTAVR